jgi:hypothetical protein
LSGSDLDLSLGLDIRRFKEKQIQTKLENYIFDRRGDRVIRIKAVCKILFVLTLLDFGMTVSLAGVDGNWKINGLGADSMVLTRSVNHVYGTYNTPQGQGTIDGTINAENIWTGTWTETFNDDWGYFEAAFSNDTSRLCGSWKYAQSDYEGYWDRPYDGDWDGSFQGVKQLQTNTTTKT